MVPDDKMHSDKLTTKTNQIYIDSVEEVPCSVNTLNRKQIVIY